MTDLTLEELRERIRSLIEDEENRPEEALRRVAESLAEDAEALRRWWRAEGATVLRRAFAPEFRSSGGGAHGTNRKTVKVTKRKGWRERLIASGVDTWDMEFPVPGTDEVKAIREWTREDVLRVAGWYKSMAHKLVFRSEYFHRIGEKMEDGQTIEEAREAGNLTAEDMGFLEDRPGEILVLTD